VLGLSTAVGQVAYALIPSILGAVRDLGDWRAVLAVCIGLQLAAAAIIGFSALPKCPHRA
jgi:hypothetical protein